MHFIVTDECVLMIDSNCPKNMRVDYDLEQCVCKTGYILNTDNECVPCSSGQIYSDGKCLVNPSLECPENSRLDENGVCITDTIKICPDNYILIGTICIPVN